MPNVKIKNYVSDDCIYEDVDKVWLASEDSTDDNPDLLPYTYGEALEGVEVTPDFSGGDMQVTVPEGYLLRSGVVKKPENLIPGNIKAGETVAGIPGEYEGEETETEEVTVALSMADGDQVIEPSEGKALSKVTLTKPETLVPENIAEGVDIGGVIGALVAGANAKISTGTEAGSSSKVDTITIEHGLGVIPDIIMISTGSQVSGQGQYTYILFKAIGISSALRNTWGGFGNLGISYVATSSGFSNSGSASDYCIEQEITAFNAYIHHATENEFQVGNSSAVIVGTKYRWLAIAGLT